MFQWGRRAKKGLIFFHFQLLGKLSGTIQKLSKNYPELSKNYPELSKNYPELSKNYPELSKAIWNYPKLSGTIQSLWIAQDLRSFSSPGLCHTQPGCYPELSKVYGQLRKTIRSYPKLSGTIQSYPELSKVYGQLRKNYPELSKAIRNYPKLSRTIQSLWIATENYPELSKSYPELPRVYGQLRKNYPELSKTIRNYPELSGTIQSYPELSRAIFGYPTDENLLGFLGSQVRFFHFSLLNDLDLDYPIHSSYPGRQPRLDSQKLSRIAKCYPGQPWIARIAIRFLVAIRFFSWLSVFQWLSVFSRGYPFFFANLVKFPISSHFFAFSQFFHFGTSKTKYGPYFHSVFHTSMLTIVPKSKQTPKV